jgi:alpha-L-fucosidase
MNAAFRDGTKIPEGAWPTDLTNGERTLPPPSGHNPVQLIDGKAYYVPMEMCETVTDNWFWHPGDRVRSIRHLHYLYRENLNRGANFLLNVSPDTTGQIPAEQVKALMDLKAMIDNPGSLRPSVIIDAKLKASNVFKNQDQYGPQNAVDNNWTTRWATDAGMTSAQLEIDLGRVKTFDTVVINEGWDRIRRFELQYELDGEWRTCLEGTLVGTDYEKQFESVAAQRVRLNILEATDGPTMWEFQLLAPR